MATSRWGWRFSRSKEKPLLFEEWREHWDIVAGAGRAGVAVEVTLTVPTILHAFAHARDN